MAPQTCSRFPPTLGQFQLKHPGQGCPAGQSPRWLWTWALTLVGGPERRARASWKLRHSQGLRGHEQGAGATEDSGQCWAGAGIEARETL